VLAKIAEMPDPDRAKGERLHLVIKASAPALSTRLRYGMPAYATQWRVSRQTVHAWLARYEVEGLELRRARPYWGPRNLVLELARRRVEPCISSR
jgi:transposase